MPHETKGPGILRNWGGKSRAENRISPVWLLNGWDLSEGSVPRFHLHGPSLPQDPTERRARGESPLNVPDPSLGQPTEA